MGLVLAQAHLDLAIFKPGFKGLLLAHNFFTVKILRNGWESRLIERLIDVKCSKSRISA